MTRLTRKNLKVFASGASNNGVFGSLQANNPTKTNDVEQIQSLPAWENGWVSATESSDMLPPLEEAQAINYVGTYQVAYILQEGVPEWLSTCEYHLGSWVKSDASGKNIIYESLSDNNIGNAVTDTSKWMAVSFGGKTFDLFDHKWSDYQLNDQSWLRADTFSWQDGTVYCEAYNHLVADYNSATASSTTYYAWYNSEDGTYYTLSPNVSAGDDVYVYYNNEFIATETVQSVETGYIVVRIGGGVPRALDRDSTKDIQVSSALQTETIAGITITYYLVDDGHKIILPDQENNAVAIYNATGVAWYYILDTANQRFKLPRTKYGFVGLRDTVGKYVEAGLPNITGNFISDCYKLNEVDITGAFELVEEKNFHNVSNGSNNANIVVGLDASNSNSIYGNSTTVQPPSTQMYLYFYVGQFSQTATEQTAGLNAELFNGKVDLDLNDMNPSATAKETIVGWGMPDYSAAISATGAYTSNNKFTAPADGILIYGYWSTTNSKIYVNDIVVGGLFGTNSGQGLCYPLVIPLSKGDTFYQEYANHTSFPYQNNRFVPFKGVN